MSTDRSDDPSPFAWIFAGALALLADIGGTNARFALADTGSPTPLQLDTVHGFAVADFPSLAEAAQHYLDTTGHGDGAVIRRAVFAVAGRVDGDHARITNHPWVISRPRLCAQLGLDDAMLANDFAAQSMAITLLGPDDVATVGGTSWRPDPPGVHRNRTYAVIGPGTGLGVGGLLVRDGRCYPLETEGGHVSFPPGTEGHPADKDVIVRLCAADGTGIRDLARVFGGQGTMNVHSWSPDGRSIAFVDYPVDGPRG